MDEEIAGHPKYFITHSWKDIEFARRISDDLNASGLKGFFDMYSVKPGDDFAAHINKGLEECDVFVPILSFAALESAWCKEEINAALNLSNTAARKGKPKIIPVLVEDCVAAMPPLLQHRLHINFEKAYLSALWQLLEKGFGIDPATSIYKADMFSGPRIQTGEEEGNDVWWGVCQVIEFKENDNGKTLKITVESSGNQLTIELWQGGFKDVKTWLQERVDVARSPRQQNPTLTWKIKQGVYTIYLVDWVHLKHSIREGNRGFWAYERYPIIDYNVLYRIEILQDGPV